MAPRKTDFALALRTAGGSLADAADDLADLYEVYWASGYNSGGSNELVAGDLTGHDITVTQVTAMITLAENLAKFLNNQDPTNADYDQTLDGLKNL